MGLPGGNRPVLLGAALVWLKFPKRDEERRLLAAYQAEDAAEPAPTPEVAPDTQPATWPLLRLEIRGEVKNEKHEQRERGDDQQSAHDDVRGTPTPAKTNLVVPQTVHVAVLSPRTPGDETA